MNGSSELPPLAKASGLAASGRPTSEYRNIGTFLSDSFTTQLTSPNSETLFPHDSLPSFSSAALQAPLGTPPSSPASPFLLEGQWAYLNHGAFGATLGAACLAANALRLQQERQPMRFFDRDLLPLLASATVDLADFLRAPARRLALTANVTTAVSAVIRTLQGGLQEDAPRGAVRAGDEIVIYRHAYSSVMDGAKLLAETTRAKLVVIDIPFPLPDDAAAANAAIVDAVESVLTDKTRIVFMDHVPSSTPFIMPVERIVQLCNARGIISLVDGAHAPGAIDLDFSSGFAPSIYVGNCHKWLCSAKGCAFIYVAPELEDALTISPAAISIGHAAKAFHTRFIWDGTRDYAAQLALPVALRFWRRRGANEMRAYMRNLANEAAAMLTAAWGTSTYEPAALRGVMTSVRLPESGEGQRLGPATEAQMLNVMNALYDRLIEIPVKILRGSLYVRVSCHIYNSIQDIERLRDAVLDIIASMP